MKDKSAPCNLGKFGIQMYHLWPTSYTETKPFSVRQ